MEFTVFPELPASNINRVRTWYREALGLELVTQNEKPVEPETEPIRGDGELLGTPAVQCLASGHRSNLGLPAQNGAASTDAPHNGR